MSEEKSKRRIVGPRWDLRGWEEIAEYADMLSTKTARTYATREEDPLPVVMYCGRARARKADISEWRERNTTPPGPVSDV